MSGQRVWLDVPYAEKDAAKAAGARWDPAAKRWYAPRPDMPALEPWAALPDLPDTLPGEDRTFGQGLFVDLVPSSCWFTNVRSCVTQRDWERLRRMITARAGRRCEACGRGEDRQQRRWLEAHERWHYDQTRRVQSLRRLICLCSWCHTTTHYGYASITGYEDAAFGHLVDTTGMTPEQTEVHVDEAFETWKERSRHDWHLDLSILTDAGVTLARPPAARDRQGIAEATIEAEQHGHQPPAAAQPADPPTNPIPVQRPAPADTPTPVGYPAGPGATSGQLPDPYLPGHRESRIGSWLRRHFQ